MALASSIAGQVLGGRVMTPTPAIPVSPYANQTTTRTAAPTPTSPTPTTTPTAKTTSPAITLPAGVSAIAPQGTPNSQIVRGQLLDMGGGLYYNTGTGIYQNQAGSITGSSPNAVAQYTNPYGFLMSGAAFMPSDNYAVTGNPSNTSVVNNQWAAQGAYGGVPLDVAGKPAWDPNQQPIPLQAWSGVLSAPGPPPLAGTVPVPNYQLGQSTLGPGGVVAPQPTLPQGSSLLTSMSGLAGAPAPLMAPQNTSPLGTAAFAPSNVSTVNPLNPNSSDQLANLLGITGLTSPASTNPLSGFGGMFSNPDQINSFLALLSQLIGLGGQQNTPQPQNPLNDYGLYGPAPDIRKNLYPIFP